MKKIYTSTGMKLIHHPEVVNKIKEGFGVPISLQVGPTSRCNLNCSFCSNSKRKTHEDLDEELLACTVKELRYLGLKTVEWTGGGDPTMYAYINFIISYCHKLGLEQGMITNGILLRQKVAQENLDRLSWLRVSMNCLDYFSHVDIPPIKGTLGFSYVMNEKTDDFVLDRLQNMIDKYNPKYVRIVPNCLATKEVQEKNNELWGKVVSEWGKPYFFQEKVFDTPKECYWCYFKPFILHDGYVYPCSSVVLNSGSEGKFHEKYRFSTVKDLKALYRNTMEPYPTKNCDHCVFKEQNDLVYSILNPEMENFV